VVAGPLTASRPAWRRRLPVVFVVLAVSLVHGCVLRQFSAHLAALGASADPAPERLTAIYVRSMEAEEPPGARGTSAAVHAQGGAPRPETGSAMAQVAAASAPGTHEEPPAPEAVASAPALPVSAASEVAGDPAASSSAAGVAEAASPPQAVASAASAASTSARASAPLPGGPPFEWPAATRVSFSLTGYYRGDVYGSAQVEWLRAEDKYQVHLDVRVGFDAAPFLSRRMSSEGRITPAGLAPSRYDQQTRLAFADPVRSTVRIDPDGVWLANGQRRERPVGVQDSASQFIQLAWLFSMRPELARPGGTVELPLALPRNVDRMVYDVQPPELLKTPFGDVPVFRLVPRQVARAGGDMTIEMWIAPRYRHLPVRLKIRQDAETFVDLMITRPPELAAGP
jgi:hypothetical protein